MNNIEMPENFRTIGKLLDSPRLWGEQYLLNRDGSPRCYWPHQAGDLECPARNIIHLDGRDCGKSVDIATLALHHAFVKMGGSVLVAAPHQGPVDTIIEEIEFQIEASDELKSSIAVNAQKRQKIIRKSVNCRRISLSSTARLYRSISAPAQKYSRRTNTAA